MGRRTGCQCEGGSMGVLSNKTELAPLVIWGKKLCE